MSRMFRTRFVQLGEPEGDSLAEVVAYTKKGHDLVKSVRAELRAIPVKGGDSELLAFVASTDQALARLETLYDQAVQALPKGVTPEWGQQWVAEWQAVMKRVAELESEEINLRARLIERSGDAEGDLAAGQER
jgi:hypothetical protein